MAGPGEFAGRDADAQRPNGVRYPRGNGRAEDTRMACLGTSCLPGQWRIGERGRTHLDNMKGGRPWRQGESFQRVFSLWTTDSLHGMVHDAMSLAPRSSSEWECMKPTCMLRSFRKYRALIGQLSRREIEGRYKGSYLGILWSFLQPVMLLIIYTFVFGVVLKSTWPEARSGRLSEFAVIVFCGMSAFGIFNDCVGRASGLIVAVPNYVKKVVFPLEILPVSVMGGALFHAGVNLAILAAANLLVGGRIYATMALLPLVFIPLVFLTMGASWFLAGLGVYFRDAQQLISPILLSLFFVTPVFYGVQAVPEPFRTLMRFNPLTSVVVNCRRVVLWGECPAWTEWAVWLLLSGVLMMLGYAFFMKIKKGFADVL